MTRSLVRSSLLLATVFALAACGGDDRRRGSGTDSGTPPPGDAGGGGGDVAVPPVQVTCTSATCATATGGTVLIGYVSPSCAAVFSDTIESTVVAGRGAPYTCTGGACTASSDDATDPWEDEAGAAVTTLASGSYGLTTWFDHNANVATTGGPDPGDTVCCIDVTVDATTSTVTVDDTATCIDL